MTIVVTDNCQGCRFTECVTVCPVAAFRLGESMLYIDPAVCIDCSACVPKCPVNAIFDEFDLPEDKREWVEINARESLLKPPIAIQHAPLPGAEQRRAELGF
ncbi:indolepyruvate ferredoxin oxidoreductase subunit alpha [Trinickia acidisoli]|uniref:indolepyruvate ferredoxin oxidoreductase subunit alpha n=1 Tax=Trinickia acidisoli TaxID=2767482 RepID=UPI001A8E7781|nr:ferredoxin family protein [Trinickia acidisoli]